MNNQNLENADGESRQVEQIVSQKVDRNYKSCFEHLKEHIGRILHELNAETGMAQKEYESAVNLENHLKCIIQHTKKDVLKSIAGRLDRVLVEAG